MYNTFKYALDMRILTSFWSINLLKFGNLYAQDSAISYNVT